MDRINKELARNIGGGVIFAITSLLEGREDT